VNRSIVARKAKEDAAKKKKRFKKEFKNNYGYEPPQQAL